MFRRRGADEAVPTGALYAVNLGDERLYAAQTTGAAFTHRGVHQRRLQRPDLLQPTWTSAISMSRGLAPSIDLRHPFAAMSSISSSSVRDAGAALDRVPPG